jgi:hypothetical protein
MLSVSQSLIKNFWKYKKADYCGIALHRMDILKEAEREATERMQLGHYFEFLCTGAKLRDGSEPKMPATKTGKPTAGSLKMQEQAKRFKELVKEKDIVVKEIGKVVEHSPDWGDFKMKGIFDIYGTVAGEKAIVDIKSSGLIGNEWEEYGWHKGTFNMRSQLTIQVIFYKYLAWEVLGMKDIPFYFAVHSSTNEVDSLFWRVDVADFEVAMNHLEDTVSDVVDGIKMESEFGFTAYPSVKRCLDCPLMESCDFSIKVPQTDIITIDGIFE